MIHGQIGTERVFFLPLFFSLTNMYGGRIKCGSDFPAAINFPT